MPGHHSALFCHKAKQGCSFERGVTDCDFVLSFLGNTCHIPSSALSDSAVFKVEKIFQNNLSAVA